VCGTTQCGHGSCDAANPSDVIRTSTAQDCSNLNVNYPIPLDGLCHDGSATRSILVPEFTQFCLMGGITTATGGFTGHNPVHWCCRPGTTIL
jgi:hypothetical protein